MDVNDTVVVTRHRDGSYEWVIQAGGDSEAALANMRALVRRATRADQLIRESGLGAPCVSCQERHGQYHHERGCG